MNFLVKKSNFALQSFRTPAHNCPSSRPLYSRFPPPLPRFRTLYPRFRTLYPPTPVPPVHPLFVCVHIETFSCFHGLNRSSESLCCVTYRPLAGYGLSPPPPRGNFVDHIFLKAQCLARILQHVSPLTMAALSCNSLLHTLPYKIFDNLNSF